MIALDLRNHTKLSKTDIISILDANNASKTDVSSVWGLNDCIEIGDYAFDGFENLQTLWDYPDNITIGKYAFRDCKRLNFNPSILTSINEGTFYGCQSLESCALTQCTVIGKYAFAQCINIINMWDLNNCISIDDHAFDGCENIQHLWNLPSNTSIGKYAFKDCKKLDFNPINLTCINDGTFYGCTSLVQVILGQCTIIGKYAFYGCSQLQNAYDIEKVISIGDHAFDGCENFQDNITLPACTEIGRYAFRNCTNLSSLVAPNCTFIDYNAFEGTKLWDVEPSA